MENSIRDAQICRLYLEGLTSTEIGDHFQLSRERIRQVLEKGGVTRVYRRSVQTDRHAFVGVDVPKRVKDAMREEAAKRGVTLSQLALEAFDKYVAA